jgi:glycosyltransferase involved in cell wall biosynthesis
VVVAHGSSTLLACGLGLAGLRTPFVYVNIGDPRYWAGTRAKRTRVRFLLHRAAAVAAIAHGSRQVLLDDFGLPPERVRVIPNGRRAAAFPPADAAVQAKARRDLGLDESGHLIAMIGALSPEKRVDVAIDALAELPADGWPRKPRAKPPAGSPFSAAPTGRRPFSQPPTFRP